jgi:plasmid replication initiation protein
MPISRISKTVKNQDKGELIIQHNHLIEARYHLTLQEKRLMCWLASQVKPTDEDFKEHDLSIREFATLVEIKGDHLYKTLDTITHKLMQKILTIKSIDDSEFTKAALLGGVKYLKKKGIIKLSFHPYLKPYMLQVKERFTKISLGDIIGLKSVHAIRIYELIKQYESIGERSLKLSELKACCGINEKQYLNFFNFKKKVLEQAKREINAKTDLLVDYDEVKTSRRITSIDFKIKRNPNYGITEFEKMQREKLNIIHKEMRSKNTLIEEITEYGFSRVTAKKFLSQYSEEVIRNAIKSVNIQIERNNVKNPKAMLRVAIQEHWQPNAYLSKKTNNP